MAKSKRVKKSVAIGTWPTPEKVIGMPTKKGKVSVSRGKYFLTIGRRKMEIPICPGTPIDEYRKLAGKEVHAAISGSTIAAIGVLPKIIRRLPVTCYWILCYFMPEPIVRRIRPEVRKKLISLMVREKIISRKLAQEIRRGLK